MNMAKTFNKELIALLKKAQKNKVSITDLANFIASVSDTEESDIKLSVAKTKFLLARFFDGLLHDQVMHEFIWDILNGIIPSSTEIVSKLREFQGKVEPYILSYDVKMKITESEISRSFEIIIDTFLCLGILDKEQKKKSASKYLEKGMNLALLRKAKPDDDTTEELETPAVETKPEPPKKKEEAKKPEPKRENLDKYKVNPNTLPQKTLFGKFLKRRK